MNLLDKAENEMRERFAKRLVSYPTADAETLLRIEQPEELLALRPFCQEREKVLIDRMMTGSKHRVWSIDSTPPVFPCLLWSSRPNDYGDPCWVAMPREPAGGYNGPCHWYTHWCRPATSIEVLNLLAPLVPPVFTS